jgi:hypothetical protein
VSVILLQDFSILDILRLLTEELSCGSAQHHPILLEDTEVGGVTGLAVACILLGNFANQH